MSSYAQSTPQQETATPAPTQSSAGPDLGAGPSTHVAGGATYLVKRGDTLWGISERTYGSGRRWRDIMAANPDKVFRGGDLILVDSELVLPMLEVEGPAQGGGEELSGSGPEGGGAPAVESPDGGLEDATLPYGVCTDFGDFMVYPDDFVGPLPETEEGGEEHVRATQQTELVAERRAAAEAEREAAVGSINELLSYDWNDWAITDAEATQALNLLGSLHLTQIQPALAGLGQTNVDRLLSNLPAGARSGPNFTRFVVALGPARAMPYLQDLLSTGVFDWAVSDGEVDAVMAVVNQAAPAQQAEFILQMPVSFQVRFAENLHGGAAISEDTLKQLFDGMPDGEVGGLKALLGARFHFEVGERGDGTWDAAGLRQAWLLLERLPPEHVAGNDVLDLFMTGGTSDGSGYYRASDDSAVIEYSDITATAGYGQIMVDDGAGGQTDVGLHSNVNLFNTVVRHEIGHAVDAAIGASGPTGYTATADAAGKWEVYADADAFADAIIAAGGGMSGHGYADEDAYESALRRAVSSGEDFNDALEALGSWMNPFSGVSSDVAPADASTSGPVAAVMTTSLWQASASPWYNTAAQGVVGGRRYHQAYDGRKWCSYTSEARTQRGVSAYQFRAPGEWFAEAYASYYSDHPDVTGNPAGTAFRGRDPSSAAWFDANVDKGHSLPAETNQPETTPGATAEGSGAATGG